MYVEAKYDEEIFEKGGVNCMIDIKITKAMLEDEDLEWNLKRFLDFLNEIKEEIIKEKISLKLKKNKNKKLKNTYEILNEKLYKINKYIFILEKFIIFYQYVQRIEAENNKEVKD